MINSKIKFTQILTFPTKLVLKMVHSALGDPLILVGSYSFSTKICITESFTIVQLGPRSKPSLSLKVWTQDEH